jgi:DNA helicase II / ATP-dependent DNA helicase PcrA
MIEKLTPHQIIKELQKDNKEIKPITSFQSEIISINTNPLEPAVIIAGAGSGKTETMSNRVLYLVANGIVAPDEILGLTFTRKAAGELSLRVRQRLSQLEKANLFTRTSVASPTITTYHSYAGKLLSEHSIRLGMDTDADPLGEAEIWQIASDVVRRWSDDSFRSTSAASTIIKDVIGLAKQILEHQVTIEEIRSENNRILEELLPFDFAVSNKGTKVRNTMEQRNSILDMVQAFLDRRKAAGELSFDDQMSIAADIATTFPDVGTLERGKYKVVLLDEYQDTSQSQLRMLSALFGKGHPVMAVGDPSQAIYTWRGASAGTMDTFAEYFPKMEGQNGRAKFTLPTTFRNDTIILKAANLISEKIKEDGGQEVLMLDAREGAGPGELAVGVFENMEMEAEAIADYFEPLWKDPARAIMEEDKKPTFAVLVRNRKQIPDIESALRARKIPVEVIGVGGLIYIPEIADIVAMMKVISDPDAGASLMRHLTGPRLNLGAFDIAGLGKYAKERSRSLKTGSRYLVKVIEEGNPDQLDSEDQFAGSIIDALDEIQSAPKDYFSPVGYQRLVRFAADLRRLRGRAGGQITDLIVEIEEYLTIESEVSLRDGSQTGRRNIDRFLDEASKYERAGGNAREFLEWLDVASKEEGGLKIGAPDVRSDVVQILTVHMAKGAEWNVVAIPGLAVRNFPSESAKNPENWLTNEAFIPFPLRGDHQELPQFNISGITEKKDVEEAIDLFSKECSHRIKRREEIRLAYVAVTRAKTHLLCTTSVWRTGKNAVAPSDVYVWLHEIAAAENGKILSELDTPPKGVKNPGEVESLEWPHDRLGERRAQFQAEIDLVKSADAHLLNKSGDDEEIDSWISDAQALISELKEKANPEFTVLLPTKLSTSALVALHENPEELALNIRRPMPRGQDQYSRRGTAFHLWVEKQFIAEPTLPIDDYMYSLDPLEDDVTLEELKKAWQASHWATKTPTNVEVPFETVIAGVLIRGRIDAVYRDGDGYIVVDWKTGSKELGESAAVQLAMYRLAWAKLSGTDITKVKAAFHYVPTGKDHSPANLLSQEELITLISGIDSDANR